MNELTLYNNARNALAQAAQIDEVKEIKDKAEAMRLYAQQHNDKEFEAWAAEIKLRAMRKIGEISKSLEKAQTIPSGVRLPAGGKSKAEVLKEAGISTSQAHRAEQVASIPEEKFEIFIEEKKNQGKSVTAEEIVKQVTRDKRREDLSNLPEPTLQAPLEGKYQLIYADPPWRYEHVRTENRAIENQYPTMTIEDICALPIRNITQDNAMLFMWATAPKLMEAMAVIEAWGFTYRTCAVWVKDRIGMGYYFRGQHELLLVAKRGDVAAPDEGNRFSSVINSPRGEHSAKPHEVYSMIEKMYPSLSRIELFSRAPMGGWAAWGNQA